MTSQLTSPFQSALDQLAMLAILDADTGHVLEVNAKFCEITRTSTNQIIGTELTLLRQEDPPSRSQPAPWRNLNAQPWAGELCLRLQDGSPLWLDAHLARACTNDGSADRVLLMGFDISARKLSELKSSERHHELEHFAFVAAHDLHEPLRKIRAFSERLINHLATSLPTESRDYLARIHSASVRMQDLIDDLLAYTRVAHNREGFTKVDLNQTLKNVLNDLELQIEKLDQPSPVHIEALPTIEADASEMHRLFQNLVSNALKFHAVDRQVKITITAKTTANACQIMVKDNGIGLEKKDVERIFNAFNRLHTQREFPGTGIGLAICRRIVDRHHGTITVDSTPGVGSEFTVTLPLMQNLKGSP